MKKPYAGKAELVETVANALGALSETAYVSHKVAHALREAAEVFSAPRQHGSAPHVTVQMASSMTGLSEKAIRNKIASGKWLKGAEYWRAPDDGIFIYIEGFAKWIERGRRMPLR